jgi:heme-degrading monooxygenase HmoA
MFVLHVDIATKPNAGPALEDVFGRIFRSTISAQQGFVSVELLRDNSKGGGYRLIIVFQDQAHQQKWVASDAHQAAWPEIENHCASVSVRSFTPV